MLRLALAQAPAALSTPADRLDWLRDTLPEVAQRGADLLLLPELFACGYNIGSAVFDRAEPLTGPTFDAIAGMAQTTGIAIHYGFAERVDGQIFNAAACVSAAGALLCCQRKLAIPPGFERDYFAPGQGCHFFEMGGLTIATLICYDAEFPETVRHVAALGADVVLVPTALGEDWPWVAETMIPTRAYENGVYLAYANSAGIAGDMRFLGRSVIAAPNGQEAARAGAGPDIIYATVHKSSVQKAQARLPYLTDRHHIRLT